MRVIVFFCQRVTSEILVPGYRRWLRIVAPNSKQQQKSHFHYIWLFIDCRNKSKHKGDLTGS